MKVVGLLLQLRRVWIVHEIALLIEATIGLLTCAPDFLLAIGIGKGLRKGGRGGGKGASSFGEIVRLQLVLEVEVEMQPVGLLIGIHPGGVCGQRAREVPE